VLQHLMGGFEPSAASFKALSGPPSEAESQAGGRPYPFFLASPIDSDSLEESSAQQWWTDMEVGWHQGPAGAM